MSQLRTGRNPDGTRTIVPLDPAVGRITHAARGVRGGGPPIVSGHLPIGESTRQRDLRLQREASARKTPPRPQRTDYGWGLYASEEPE